jgi:acetaldehyde dehydrogenase (acetylating)
VVKVVDIFGNDTMTIVEVTVGSKRNKAIHVLNPSNSRGLKNMLKEFRRSD